MEIEKFISEHTPNENQRIIDPNGTIVIPVVVHILHDGSPIGSQFNPSMLTIQTQINVLNQDFRRQNADRTNTPTAFQGVAADMNIEFRLACIDPNGNPTTGVTRRDIGNKTFTVDLSKANNPMKFTSQGGQDAWTTSKYLNIWVCRLNNGLLGYTQSINNYATHPNTDGIVINTTNFGFDGITLPPFDRGRVATHEVGHWMGLKHVWGDDRGACSGSDEVTDTPNQANANYGCPPFPTISCDNSPNGDMFMNFMDYTNDACKNMFTQGQRARARALFMNGGIRSSFANGYFTINSIPTSRSCSSLTVSLQNQSCLPVTWSVTGGTATNQSNTGATINGNSGTVTVTATSGNYTDTKTFYLGSAVINPPAIGRQFCKTYYYEFQNYVEFTGNGFSPLEANFEVVKAPNSVSFSYYVVDNKMYIQPHTLGIIAFRVRVLGYCGWSNWQLFQYDVINCGAGGGFFRAYPNPTKDSFTLDFEPEEETTRRIFTDDLKIELYNSYQKVVFETILKKEQKEKKLKIDVSRLPHGVYYLKVIDGKEVYTERIMIGK